MRAEISGYDITVHKTNSLINKMKRQIFLYILLLPAILLVFFFNYVPLPGLLISFMDYDIFLQWKSPWVGFDNIIKIFQMPMMLKAIANTLMISVLSLLVCFPLPIIFALLLNELKNGFFKRFVQTVSYLPHFLSWISVIGIAVSFLSLYGPINDLRVAIFGEDTERILFLTYQWLFVPNVLILSAWKGMGWNSIIYLAALTSIDPQLYEAAHIDGANRFKQLIHITLPGIMPTAIMLLILNISHLFASNFELIYGLRNAFIDFDVISTVVYEYGIVSGNYSVSAAFGLLEGFVSFLLIIAANKLSKTLTEVSIW